MFESIAAVVESVTGVYSRDPILSLERGIALQRSCLKDKRLIRTLTCIVLVDDALPMCSKTRVVGIAFTLVPSKEDALIARIREACMNPSVFQWPLDIH